jgi:hypothetical protein
MILEINEQYRIVTDESNYTLQQSRIIKDEESKRFGETDWSTVGYYGDLEWLYRKCLSIGLKQEDLNGLQAILKEINRIGQEIKESISMANLDLLLKKYEAIEAENESLKKKLSKQEV